MKNNFLLKFIDQNIILPSFYMINIYIYKVNFNFNIFLDFFYY